MPAVILLLAIFGGTQFFINPRVLVGFILAYIVLAAVVAARRPTPPVVMSIFVWPVIALILAAIINWGGWWMVCRLWLCSAALLLMLLQVDPSKLRIAILTTGAAYPLALWLAPYDNRNIQAAWPLIFAAAALASPASVWRWLYFAGQVGLLLWLGSRGAILGLAAALALYYVVYFRWRSITLGLTGMTILVGGLAALRLRTALIRFSYWQSALEAFISRPVFGLGPGGLIDYTLKKDLPSYFLFLFDIFPAKIWIGDAAQMRISGSLHVHAHNFIISLLAEGGLVGLAGLGLAIRRAYQLCDALAIERWHLCVLAGLAAQSLVDEPLWWPGPLLVTALIIGSIGEKRNGKKDCL